MPAAQHAGKVKALALTVEYSVENIPNSPGEYWDHLNIVAPPEKSKL